MCGAVAVTLDWFTLKSAGSHYALTTDLHPTVLFPLNSLKLNVKSAISFLAKKKEILRIVPAGASHLQEGCHMPAVRPVAQAGWGTTLWDSSLISGDAFR